MKNNQGLTIRREPKTLVVTRQYMVALCILLLFITLVAPVRSAAAAQSSGLTFSDAERAWLARHPVVKIPFNEDYPPFHMLKDDKRVGLNMDYLNIISEKTGITILVVSMPWVAALQEIGSPSPSVDIVMEITASPERAQQMILTKPYLTAPHVIITRKDAGFFSGLKDLSKKTVVMEKDYMSTEWVRQTLPKNTIQEVDATHTALALVASGKADAYVGNLAVASYLMDTLGFSNLKVASSAAIPDDALTIGIRKDWPELAGIINKVFDSLSHEEHQQLRQKWLAIRYEHGITPKQVAFWLLLAAGGALVFIIPLKVMVRRRTRELQESMELLEAMTDNTLQLQGLLSTDGTILKVNQAALAMTGCARSEVIGRLFWEGPWWKGLPQEQQRVIHAVEQGQRGATSRFETIHYASDGSLRTIDFSLRPMTDQTGRIRYLIPEGRDITESKQAEKALKTSEEKYRLLFQSAPVGIFQSLPEGRFVSINQAFAQMFGYASPEEMLEQESDIPTHIYADHSNRLAILEQLATNNTLAAEEIQFLRKDGTHFWGALYIRAIEDTQGSVQLLEGFVVDITGRKHTQELIIQHEKMAMIAGLAAGIAHEINNPLGIIVQDLQLLERRLNPALQINQETADAVGIDLDTLAEYLKQRDIYSFISNMREAGRRASNIVKGMLQFGRTGNDGKQPADLNKLCDQAITLASTDYDLKKSYDFKNIIITRDYCSTLPLVPVVASELEQVLINLLKNAAQALFVKNHDELPATITVHTSSNDSYAEISVSDNGPGIPDKIRSRIFEPFFTTKEAGAGTGLGLAVSYAIITERHGGTMRAACPDTGGTCFTIRLPLDGSKDKQYGERT